LPSSDNIICDSSSHEIEYVKFVEIIEGYTNANWILILVTQKSTTGYVFTLGGGVRLLKGIHNMNTDIVCVAY